MDIYCDGQKSLEYMDIKRSELYLKVRIKHADGWSLKTTEYVGPVNLFMQSLFGQVDVTIQIKLVTSTTTHYPDKSMIQTLLSYGTDAKKSQLTSQLGPDKLYKVLKSKGITHM